MNNLRQFIGRVLAKRQQQKPRLEAVQKNLQDFWQGLRHLHQLASETSANGDAPPDLQQRAASLATGIDNMESRVDQCVARTANLLARFGKNTINIGVAGKTGMGKSTVLQAISGLDDQTIPTSAGEPCTGAKSKLLHDEGEPHAIVEYFNEREFLTGIVHSYFSDLGLSPSPQSLSNFAQPLPSKPKDLSPVLHAVYDKLETVHRFLPRYRQLLLRAPERVGLDSIRPYVSQDDGRYLAVKCASIYARFPHGDVSGLGLIDLPGLGEIAKGHGEKLVRSLEQDVDAVIVIKRPPPGRAVWDAEDHKVFDLVKQTVPELELSDWLFVVLNRDLHNAEQVAILQKEAPKIGSEPRIVVADCHDQKEVGEKVFLEVLRHLEANLERIDLQQTSVLAGYLSGLGNEAVALVAPVADYFQRDRAGTDDYQKFGELFSSFGEKLRTNLDELTDEYRQLVRTNGMAKQFGAAVDEACDAAKTNVPMPSAAELKGRYHNRGGWEAVITDELHHLRAYLTHCLADILDRRLGQMVEEVQRKIMARLLAEPLGRILPQEARQNASPRRQLEDFRRMLDRGAAPTLIAGIDYLLSFSFSYQSHFHHRVRETMNPLDPMASREAGEDNPVFAISPRESGAHDDQDVARGLRSFYERVVWNVRKRLHQEMENDPMRAIFSMVEETRDRLARAKEIEKQWERLLYPCRAEIWPEEFNRFAVASALRQEWQESIETVNRSANKVRTSLE